MREVVKFDGVFGLMVKEFPFSFSNGNLFPELPEEFFVLFLAFLAEKGGKKRDAVALFRGFGVC